jgi:molybdopterin-containing oxidoreductase family iron-sulfur binding subunit
MDEKLITQPERPRDSSAATRIDLAAIRRKLANTTGKQYWRSLEELAETDDFEWFLHNEFPRQSAVFGAGGNGIERRDFLKLMGASLVLAGLNACTRQPEEKIVPYVRQPEQIIPGRPLFFATAIPLGGIASGVLVESHMGRPTKVEGNPDHPASLGATDAFAQAAVLTLYDPDRSQVITNVGDIRPWSALLATLRTGLEGQREQRGAGLRLLTETVTSPTLASQIRALLTDFPLAKWHQYEPVNRDQVYAGARRAFGENVETQYRFDKAEVVLALDADFLSCGPAHVRYVRDFSSKRRVQNARSEMNRLYAVESTPSNTGAMADHRLALRPSEIEDFARSIAAALGVPVQTPGGLGTHPRWTAAIVADLQRHRGTSIVIAGDEQPPIVHTLVHVINHALGNHGQTVIHTDPVPTSVVPQTESLRELVADMDSGKVAALMILGGNPVFNAPVDIAFGAALSKVPLSVHLSLYDDETSELCHWHIPEAQCLESWSDARAYDGTITIMQPLIAPLYGGKTAHEVLAAMSDHPDRSSHDIVRDYWKTQHPSLDFEHFWRKSLHDGLVAGSALPAKSVSLRPDWDKPRDHAERNPKDDTLEIIFRPDATIFDGRFANNGWLQELPKSLTRMTWDNAALIAPATAERLGLASEDLVEVRYAGRTVRAPIWIMPGHVADAVTIHFGHGRTRAGRVGNSTGFNAYTIRTANAPWSASGATLRKTGETYPLACTQHHHSMEGRHLALAGTIEEYRTHPDFIRELAEQPAADMTLYPNDHPYDSYAWGMAIDLNSCTGCNACAIACQAENNIPIVGKTEVARGHEMHWIRVDRYYAGNLDNPTTYHQPVPCMHCENAPCEVVCPVGATTHSSEGLNDMVYNRCVGTKYCSNNCPYKVRRFNWFLYSNQTVESLKMAENPDVTVRSRGVMEKCTYCVQRINFARIEAQKEDRGIRDGEIVTACQQVCPAEAIVFGNINDPQSRVATLKAEARNYSLLGELNTRPRTTYLARLRNPNPELGDEDRA